jgi:hypothetical protein
LRESKEEIKRVIPSPTHTRLHSGFYLIVVLIIFSQPTKSAGSPLKVLDAHELGVEVNFFRMPFRMKGVEKTAFLW